MRKLTRTEWMALVLLGDRIRREVDADLGNLVLRGTEGDGSAFVAAVDRLYDLGRDADADRLKAVVMG